MVNIPNPCQEDINAMNKCGNKISCSLCVREVVDLRKSSTKDVLNFTQNNPGECVVIHTRHKSDITNAYNWINKVESFLNFLRLKRTSILVCSMLLFITSCASRKKHRQYAGKFEPKTIVVESENNTEK